MTGRVNRVPLNLSQEGLPDLRCFYMKQARRSARPTVGGNKQADAITPTQSRRRNHADSFEEFVSAEHDRNLPRAPPGVQLAPLSDNPRGGQRRPLLSS